MRNCWDCDYGGEFNELRAHGVKKINHMNIEISRMKGRSSFGKRLTVSWMLRVFGKKEEFDAGVCRKHTMVWK